MAKSRINSFIIEILYPLTQSSCQHVWRKHDTCSSISIFPPSFVLIKGGTLVHAFPFNETSLVVRFPSFFTLAETFFARFFDAGYVFFLVPSTRTRSTWVSPPSNTLTTRPRRFRCMSEREVKGTPRANRFPSFTEAPTAEGRRWVASTTQSETDNGPRSHRAFKHLNREESVQNGVHFKYRYVKIAKNYYVNPNYPIPYLL